MGEDHIHSANEESAPRADTVQSVVRCFALLEALGANGEASMAQLATSCQLPRPVIRRLLLTLRGLGYVESTGALWRITPALARFGTWAVRGDLLLRVAAPHLRRAADRLDETVVICRRDARACRIVAAARVEHLAAVRTDVGHSLPLHATAAGQVLLGDDAALPPGPLEAFTDHTLVDPTALAERVAAGKRDGFVVAVDELEPGLIAAAVPILDPSGTLLASLNVAAPAARFDAEHMRRVAVPLLQQTAAAITADLG